MITSEVIFKYENTKVTFLAEGRNVMVNATEMAKPFGRQKKPSYWLHTNQAKDFVKALSKSRIIDLTDLLKVTCGGKSPGTWMNEDLALEFARWLSPEFGIWCNDKIKELLKKGVVSLNEQEKMLFGKKSRSWKIKWKSSSRTLSLENPFAAAQTAFQSPYFQTFWLVTDVTSAGTNFMNFSGKIHTFIRKEKLIATSRQEDRQRCGYLRHVIPV